MSVYLGPRAAIDLMFEVGGIDAAKVMDFQNRNGLTAEQVVTMAGAAIGAANATILERYGGLFYLTGEVYARYRNGEGAVGKTPRKSEFVPADGVRGRETGNMLPLFDHEDALEWSAIYLRDAYESSLRADLQVVTERWENRVDTDIMERVFSNLNFAMGTGYVVPWAIGDDANVPFIPPQYRLKEFDSTHTHFLTHANQASSDYAAILGSMIVHLRHHGIMGNLTAFVSDDDVDKYTGMTGFQEIKHPDVTIVTGGSAAVETVTGINEGLPGEIFGYFNTKGRGRVALRSWGSIPTTYLWMTRSYGINNPGNGIAVRVHSSVPFGLRPDVRVTSSLTPEIERIALRGTFGVGVNDRLNGVVGQVNNAGAYSAPTWS